MAVGAMRRSPAAPVSWAQPPTGAGVVEPDRVALLDRPSVRGSAWAAAGFCTLLVLFRLFLAKPVPMGSVLFGMVIGCIYALLAVGLILIYRANRIVNFAGAEIGVFGAILFENLLRDTNLPWVVAALAGVAAAGALSGVCEALLMRRFARAPRLIATVATIGIAQLVVVATYALANSFGEVAVNGSGLIDTPFDSIAFFVGGQATGVRFTGDALVLAASVPLVVYVLDRFLRRTDFGVAVRAAAESGERAELLGVPVRRVSTLLWVLAGSLAGLATILRAPVVGLVSGGSVQGPNLLLRALAAAVLARMDDIRLAVIAALGLGILDYGVYFGASGSTVTDAIFAGVIVIGLLVQRPRSTRFAEGAASGWQAVEEVRPVPQELRRLPEVRVGRVAAILAVAALAVGYGFVASPSRVSLAAVIAIYGIVAVSLVVLTGWAGQISLGQFGIAGFGAAVGARLMADAGWDVFWAMAGGGLAGAAVSVVLGSVALRLRGFFFAVSSLGFAVSVQTFFLNEDFFPHLTPTNRPLRPVLFETFDLEEQRAYYWFCLAMLTVVVAAVVALRRSRTARTLIAVRDNDRAAQAYGISAVRAKLNAFAISGFLAGVAGVLLASHQHAVTASAYTANESLKVFSMAVIGGVGSIPGALLGALYVQGATFLLSSNLALLATGAGLLLVLLAAPGGIGRALYASRDAALRRVAGRRRLEVPSLVRDRRVDEPIVHQPPAPDEAHLVVPERELV